MKRPYESFTDDASGETVNKAPREFPKRKVAMIMGYSGTGYQGMQR